MIHSVLRTATAAALLLTISACGAPEATSDQAEPEGSLAIEPMEGAELIARGEAMAETLCAQCHAVRRTGDSPHREAIKFRQISWRYPVGDLAEPLAEGIMVGHPDMPEWQFEPMDIQALLMYIESIQEPRGT